MITKDEIKTNVSKDPRWAERAILALYDRQTQDEQDIQQTNHRNSMGFNAFDAEILSSFAIQIKDGRRLSEKQLAIAFKRLPKYSGQLFEIAQTKSN